MVPRLKPYLGRDEIRALAAAPAGTVARYEREFACRFGASEAIAFPYGRSALRTLLEALGIRDREVVLPAYTCVVVAHAIVLSGNRCRFIDVERTDFNARWDELEQAIGPRTGAVIATHLFGYPMDLDRLGAIVSRAETSFGTRIRVIHDCAHAFGARWRGRLVTAEGDATLFGLGISKTITSIFGGMITTRDAGLAAIVREQRDRDYTQPGWLKRASRRAYLLAVYPAFDERVYGIVRWLQDETPALDRLTKAYHLDDRIHFPPDAAEAMSDVEAAVGLAQLGKYDEAMARRRDHAAFYDAHLQGRAGWTLPPLVDGATYSHYVVQVDDPAAEVRRFLRRGIQLGTVIDYSIPHMSAYRSLAPSGSWPNSLHLSRHVINLPIHAGLSAEDRARVIECALAA